MNPLAPGLLGACAFLHAPHIVHAQNTTPSTAQPPIAIPFTLQEPGFVTLVIEDAQGRRVRNLISETPYPVGRNVAYWDGLDDLGRDPSAYNRGVYSIPVVVDRKWVGGLGGWGSEQPSVEAALAVAGDRLFAAFKTDDANLLLSKPDSLASLFKGGGALDLMLGNVEGGQRLLITRVDGKTTAVLYRPRDEDAGSEPTKFTSNIGTLRTVAIDRVQDVSAQVLLAQDGTNFEVSVPLSLLKWQPQAGQVLRGDIGVLRGNGFQTTQRAYWRNKATGLTSDLASEAELTPQLWGQWEVKATP